MGRDKAFVDVDGAPMVLRVVEALHRAGATEVRVTGGDQVALERAGLVVDPDPEPFAGPLAGLITALGHAAEEVVVVLSCDTLQPAPEAIRAVVTGLGDADGAVPVTDGQPQWLHGAWRRAAGRGLADAYDGGARAIRSAASELDIAWVEPFDAAWVADADTPGDLARATYAAPMEIPEIDVEELATRREQGVPLLDVRQPDEYEQAHVPGAVLVPLDQLPERIDDVPEGDLHVICKMGGRSAKAVEFLASQGRDATNVAGGTSAWIDAGHPVDRGAGSA